MFDIEWTAPRIWHHRVYKRTLENMMLKWLSRFSHTTKYHRASVVLCSIEICHSALFHTSFAVVRCFANSKNRVLEILFLIIFYFVAVTCKHVYYTDRNHSNIFGYHFTGCETEAHAMSTHTIWGGRFVGLCVCVLVWTWMINDGKKASTPLYTSKVLVHWM